MKPSPLPIKNSQGPNSPSATKRINWNIYVGSLCLNLILIFMHLHSGMNREINALRSSTKKMNSRDRIPASRIDLVKEFHSAFKDMGSDKTYSHGYQFFYGPHLAPFQGMTKVKLLEIGAQKGNSAAGWTQYFEDVHVDMLSYGGSRDNLVFEDESCSLGDCSKIHMFHGDQSDTDMLEKMSSERPEGWDIIIDDASHVPEHNIITFEKLWKNLRPGGLYIVEDMQTSYWRDGEIYGYRINGGILAPAPRNSLNRFKQYADVINRGYWGELNKDFSYFEGDHEIEEVGFSRNIVFIRKALSPYTLDSEGHAYQFYPTGHIVGAMQHQRQIMGDLVEAKAIFDRQSLDLDGWRTAPSTSTNI